MDIESTVVQEKARDQRSRKIALASSLFAVAAIACVAVLFATSGTLSQDEQMLNITSNLQQESSPQMNQSKMVSSISKSHSARYMRSQLKSHVSEQKELFEVSAREIMTNISQVSFLLHDSIKLNSIEAITSKATGPALKPAGPKPAGPKPADHKLTPQQKKYLNHIINQVAHFQFQVLDQNKDKSVTQAEFTSIVEKIFSNAVDRAHLKKDFSEINKNKPFTEKELIAYIEKSMNASVEQSKKPYLPKEKTPAIQKRLANLVVNDNRIFEITYTFIFNIFDVNEDKTINKKELVDFGTAFFSPKISKKEIQQKIDEAFAQLEQLQISQDDAIHFDNWKNFALAIRPMLQEQVGTMPGLQLLTLGF